MSAINTFDGTINFWDMHPQFQLLGSFRDLYKEDKVKGKSASSKIMWAVAFLIDPDSRNAYRNIPEEEKKDLIAKDYLKKANFNWGKYEELVDFYKKTVMTPAKRSLVSWNEVMMLRDKETKGLYKEALKAKDLRLILDLDKIIAQTPKFFNDYATILTRFQEEEEKISRGRGNKINSLTDGKEI